MSNSSQSTNSLMTCLQTPQGGQMISSLLSEGPPTIAIAAKSFSPSLTALNIAVLSAQFPGE